MEQIVGAAKFLYDNKKFAQAAQLLEWAVPFASDSQALDSIYCNARMCYFLANDVPAAYRILEMQEDLGINDQWEIKRDKANFLRYLNRHEEAYELANSIPDEKTKFLALGWFLHKQGKIKQAFDITEKSRTLGGHWWRSPPEYDYQPWTGQQVTDLVVYAESGYGDQIIFSRWIPMLKDRCDNLYYDGDTSIKPVFCRNYGIEPLGPDRPRDLYLAPIMSLPYLLGIDSADNKPYLTCKPRIRDNLDQNFPKEQDIRIGICTHGDTSHVETTLRTLPLRALVDSLHDLGEIVNLEKENHARDQRVRYIPFDLWEDTLALIDSCDLVVSCDTSISHAAAAMGKKTIVLMHAAAYFTWNHNQDMAKTPWYENAWCVHQDEPCDWTGSIAKTRRLAEQLLTIGRNHDT